MSYESFIKEVRKKLEDIINQKLDDGVVVVRNVLKNNNVRMKAVSILRKEESTTPTIYLNNYYLDYKRGRTVENICYEIFEMYLGSVNEFKSDINLNDIVEFEKIKNIVYYKIVNYEMNKEQLSNIPHFKFQDLALVFFIMISRNASGQATALIDNTHIEGWNITPEYLRDIAFKNTWEQFPPVIKNMEDIVSEMILKDIVGDEEWVEEYDDEYNDDDCISEDTQYGEYTYGELTGIIKEEVENLKVNDFNMYVLTNNIRFYGATCITYPNVIKEFADEHNSDVVIIPSSIHEVILIPKSDLCMDSIDEMIENVNRQELDKVDVLSNHRYVYKRNTGEIEY
jgi:hypothetical protein